MRVRIDRIARQAVDLHHFTDIRINRVIMRLVHIVFRDGPEGITVRYDNTLIIFGSLLRGVVLRVGTEGADSDGGSDDQAESQRK